MKKILITGALHPVALENLGSQSDLEIDYRPDLPYDEIIKIISAYHCIISRSETNIDKTMIEKGVNLQVIARAAVGIGNIDTEYATFKGILVFNTPAKNTNSAAELTISLMISCMRNVITAHKSMESNRWDRHKFTGTELLDKTVGLIGLGNVGHRVARFLNSFDCEVLAYDPYVTKEYCEKHQCEQVNFDTLIERSDIISIHTPKNKETINMIDRKQIGKMKEGVILINAARGGLFNEEAIKEGLETKKIKAVGIDTWDVEPVKEHPLKSFSNVIMTPHIGASTLEAQLRIGESVSKETIKALKGEIVNSPVNLPDVKVFEGSHAPQYSVLAGKLGTFSKQFMDKDFFAKRIEFLYRGKLVTDDWPMIKLSFLRGFLQGTVDTQVSFVNVLKIADSKGLKLEEVADKDFSDYESAIRVKLVGENNSVCIGGTVFGGDKLRLSYLNGFIFEIDPVGNMIVIENHDKPGVIGHVGTVLSNHMVNINQFELSRNKKGGQAMAIVLVDENITDQVIDELNLHENIRHVKRIQI
ncbi:MAG: phosphoglycerate dehydrogenase [Deltaproteobacteria bacterium]|nr:phosphoglycerate dehydrogenase [Deltaproteobacteria bacterium]